MKLFLGALEQGLLYGVVALGVYLTFRVLRAPDLTVDGSFTLGGAISAVFVLAGWPLAALPAALAMGALAGLSTGLLQIRVGVAPILSGVITMSGLYTVNLAIQGGAPNLSLLRGETLFEMIPGLSRNQARFLLPPVCCIAVLAVLVWFLRTECGMGVRAAGSHPAMARAQGVHVSAARVAVLMLANSCTALAGGLLVQYQGYSDVNGGSGSMLVGLAGIVLGESIFRPKGLPACLTCAVAGTVAYQMLLALAVRYSVFPAYALKLVSAFLVAVAIGLGRKRGGAEPDG